MDSRWSELIWNDLGWFGLIWSLGWSQLILGGLGWSGLILAKLSWFGLIWDDFGSPGLIWDDLGMGGTIGFWHLTSEKTVWGDKAGQNIGKHIGKPCMFIMLVFFSPALSPPTSSTPLWLIRRADLVCLSSDLRVLVGLRRLREVCRKHPALISWHNDLVMSS